MRRKMKAIVKSKLFIFSLVFYLLVPLLFLFVFKVNLKSRTAGTYIYYENGVPAAKAVLEKDNEAYFEFYVDNCHDDIEYKNRAVVKKWSYRASSWRDNYDPEKFAYLSREYIRFGGDQSEAFFILFKIGNKLYTDYLLDGVRGGTQKCYIKS